MNPVIINVTTLNDRKRTIENSTLQHIKSEKDNQDYECAPKRKKIDKMWKKEKTFNNYESAVQAIKSEGVWGFAHKNIDRFGCINRIYRCNKVKRKGEQCQAGVYLHCRVENAEVILYRSELPHTCPAILSKSKSKISEDVKDEIKNLLEFDDRIKPRAIMRILSKKNLELPKITDLNNYLSQLRKRMYGDRPKMRREPNYSVFGSLDASESRSNESFLLFNTPDNSLTDNLTMPLEDSKEGIMLIDISKIASENNFIESEVDSKKDIVLLNSTDVSDNFTHTENERRETGLTDDCFQAKMKKDKKSSAAGSGDKSAVSEMKPWPSFIQDRLTMWDKLKAQYDEELVNKPQNPIKVTLPDGKEIEGITWKTTPYDIAKSISQGLADNAVISKVNHVLWDLDRPLEGDCQLELLKFDDPEAQAVFWHSSAHIMGEAMERIYGGCLCYGPPIELGFYYDMFLDDKGISNLDFPHVEQLIKNIVKEKQPFERLEMKKEDLLEMFKYNPFKVRILNEKVNTPTTTVYRCGPLIDLCRGPHVRHTGKVKAIKITKSSSTYWEGKADAETLQRMYGISFPDAKQLKEWEKFQEEAAKRDHRKIGKEQELFFFHELSPGSCFFQPRGAHIYNTLINFIRAEYRKRGFTEVVSPNIYNAKLWQTSGHWAHYAENMFSFDVEKDKFALKPMNCPGHCLMFDNRTRSWRELPLRYADFGVLHRNELSGALTGLTRVRRFQQDDAHIFCAVEQIKEEIKGGLDFLKHVYGIFGFTFNLVLSTRPEKYLGELEDWNNAEKALEDSLNEFGEPWKLNPGDGAFYGPKIDITINDALKRAFQCATIQLDFQLPIRFNLSYVSESGEKKRPVIIHRAVLGSVERMIAILTENYAGKWPFWLSPRQAMVIPVGPNFDEYAQEVQKKVFDSGFMCEVDTDAGDTMNKKIRNAQLAQFNFILVVGEKERSSKTVNVRTRDNVVHGEVSIDDLIIKFGNLRDNFIKTEDTF